MGRPVTREDTHGRSQLEAMRASNMKLKIEAISAISFSQLSEVYIPAKILDGPI